MLVKPNNDRGMVLPLFALVLVLLLVMVAFAVDLGAAAERRRASQNRSDAAALAAAQTLGTTQAKFADAPAQTSAMAAAVAAAQTYVEQNGGISGSDPQWTACTDSNALARVSATTPCISFSTDLTQVRVRVPDETVDYQFATVVGINAGTVRSSAIAEVVSDLGGSLRPILLTAGAAGLNCIEAGGRDSPCEGYRIGSGDYGTMESPRYSVVPDGGDPTNYALGLDHMLRLTATNGVNYCDSDSNGDVPKCAAGADGGVLNNQPGTHDLANYVVPLPGGALGPATNGVVGDGPGSTTFVDPVGRGETITALLYRPDGASRNTFMPAGTPSTPHIAFGTGPNPRTGLNGVHVSRYLLLDMVDTVGCTGAPAASQLLSVDDPTFAPCNDGLSNYIIDNPGSSVPVFSRDIIDSPRFGVAPVTDTSLSGGSDVARIVDFIGIYLNRIYGTPSGQLKSIEAFVFPLRLIEPSPTGGGVALPYTGGPFSVQLIR